MMNRRSVALTLSAVLAACGSDKPTPVDPVVSQPVVQCNAPAGTLVTAPGSAKQLNVLGLGTDCTRYTAELAVRGNTAYTTTWGNRAGRLGNKVNIWDVSASAPKLVDSLIVPGTVSTTGDVAISDDGSLLMVATETTGGSIAIYSLANPRQPSLITQYHTANTDAGVHTAKFGRINGKLYGFLSIDPRGATRARLVIVDLSLPAAPREVFTTVVGNPYIHDVFIRDGLLFVALWDDGMQIWDIGGAGLGGSPDKPVVIGGVKTLNGEVHNIWWYQDPTNGSKRYAFIGEEGPGSIGSSSRGDIHVVDISDPTKPKEVAFYKVDGAGTHNFSVDEQNGVLYAAYYNGGVRALDIRGDLGTCTTTQQDVNLPANLTRCDLRAMGREIAVGLNEINRGAYIWGVQYVGGTLYASDMLNGLWKLSAAR